MNKYYPKDKINLCIKCILNLMVRNIEDILSHNLSKFYHLYM